MSIIQHEMLCREQSGEYNAGATADNNDNDTKADHNETENNSASQDNTKTNPENRKAEQ